MRPVKGAGAMRYDLRHGITSARPSLRPWYSPRATDTTNEEPRISDQAPARRTRRAQAALGAIILTAMALPIVGLWLARTNAIEKAHRLASLGMPVDTGAADLWDVIYRTIALSATVSIGALALGTTLAWLEHRVDVRGRRLLALGVLLPLAVPSYLLAGTIQRAVEPQGLIGAIFDSQITFTGFWPSALVLILVTAPYVHLLVGAALTRIPGAELEAARSLGHDRWSCFRHIIFPRLRPSLSFALLLVSIYTISDFGCVSVLDCKVLTWRIYQAQAALQVVAAVDMGFGILALVVPLILASRLLHGRTRAERGVANPRPAPPVKPGPLLTVLAYGLPLMVITFAVLSPIAELCQWLQSGLDRGETLAPLTGPIRGTLALATLGLIVIMLLASVTAWISSSRSKASGLLDGLLFLMSGLPGVLVAFGLALAALWVPPALGLAPASQPPGVEGVVAPG